MSLVELLTLEDTRDKVVVRNDKSFVRIHQTALP